MKNNDILIERHDRVVLLKLNRPEALNALNSSMLQNLIDIMTPLDSDTSVGCFVITGSEKAFAAGADIKELASLSYLEMFHQDFLSKWDVIAKLRTPKIAAVAGYALGGGCELAMLCDTIFAAYDARFGQPEIKLGLIPGMGGSQRLTRLVGKALAMDMVLTGRTLDALEAQRAGLVARVIPADQLLSDTLETARTIANSGKVATIAACEAVNYALETGLQQGLLHERRMYHALWATQDANEGMKAFIEKREPSFIGK